MALAPAMVAEVVKLYYSSCSPISVIREMQKRYPNHERLTRVQVHRIVKRFELDPLLTEDTAIVGDQNQSEVQRVSKR